MQKNLIFFICKTCDFLCGNATIIGFLFSYFSYHGSTHYIAAENPSLLNANKRKQWSSCHALTADTHSSNQPMGKQNFSNQPIGKLQMVNPDGTQVIQLTKPEDEPIGFFIAKGNAKYGNGQYLK